MPPVLEARQLNRHFGARTAGPFDFRLAEGEHLVVTGPSGSGKTTLLRLLAGLLPPSEGLVLEDGVVVNSSGARREPHRRSLGMLFQELALWPHMTVEQQLAFALPRGASRTRERIGRALEEVHLEALARAYPADLSGGERQRVAWARAVVSEPRILLLDEPLTSLDPRLKEELLQAIDAFAGRPGHTLIVATHDLGLAARAGFRRLELVAVSQPPPSRSQR